MEITVSLQHETKKHDRQIASLYHQRYQLNTKKGKKNMKQKKPHQEKERKEKKRNIMPWITP